MTESKAFIRERKPLPYPMAKIANYVPESIFQTCEHPEVTERLGDSSIGEALRQICWAEFSVQEWGALLEAEAIINRLKQKENNIHIDYRGPDVGELKAGANDLSVSQWSDWFGVPIGYRLLLFSLVRQLKPKVCLELGTAAGLSSLYMTQGLVLNQQGKLHTIEGDANSFEIGKETLWPVKDYAQIHLGLFEEVLQKLLPHITPIDIVFIDGAHTGTDEIEYATRLAEHLSPGAIVAYDDIHWSANMAAAWQEIRNRPEVEVSLDLGKIGLIQARRTDGSSSAYHFTAVGEGYGARTPGVKPENLMWIFGSPRSGSTWLRDIMQAVGDNETWEEPFVGDLFGHFYYERAQEGQLKARTFVMGEPVRESWIRGIRQFVLEVAKGQFASSQDKKVIVKEPNGSIGAPLLLEAFPESRMILLIRDPRDVAASYLDASRRGAWLHNRRSRGWIKESEYADRDPDTFVKLIAREYVQHVSNAHKAYESHLEGRKSLIRYEDLRADTLGTMKRVYRELEMEADEDELAGTVDKHAWESIPKEEKGEGKFYRKAEPGGWREDLTPGQVEVVERITAPILEEFYGE